MRISFSIRTEPASPPRAGPCARPPLSPPAGAASFPLPGLRGPAVHQVPAADPLGPAPQMLTRLTYLSFKPHLFPARGHRTTMSASGQALPARRASRRRTAPCLDSGWLPFPHFGDWTQDGQPTSQSQAEMACLVAPSQSRAAWKPRSANPAPPSYPSYTKTVSLPVAGCRSADTPPMSHRSQVANSGRRPIEACSAACAAPPRSTPAPASLARTVSATVHQIALVSRLRGGRSRGVSPSGAPVSARRLVKQTTWRVTWTSPKLTSASPQAMFRNSPRISTSVTDLAVVV